MRLRFSVIPAVVVLAGLCAQRATAQAAQAPTVTVGGVGYLNYYYQMNVDSSLSPPAHGNNFDVARSYVNVLGKFSGGITSRITVDVDSRRAAPMSAGAAVTGAGVTGAAVADGAIIVGRGGLVCAVIGAVLRGW